MATKVNKVGVECVQIVERKDNVSTIEELAFKLQ